MTTDSMRFSRSAKLLTDSKRSLSGGVSSGMRASAKPLPLFFDSASGSRLTDVDGTEYIDYTLAWGPLILGHSHPVVTSAIKSQLDRCQLLGAQSELEIKVASTICRMVPCAERLVFSNTGTEAVQVAIRLSRAFTRRRKILRFEGHYHGWLDNVLLGYHPTISSDNGLKFQWPTEGMNPSAVDEVVVLPWNNAEAVEKTLNKESHDIAAIITEPINCNCGCLMPLPGYLEALRELATRFGVVLIFDEVITGFRVASGGAQSLFGVTPDLAVFGKAVAGGYPLSVVAGKKEILDLIENNRVIHAGTFNGNPVSLAAALATLTFLNADEGAAFEKIRITGETLISGIRSAANDANVPIAVCGVGSAFHIGFTKMREPRNYRDTLSCDTVSRDHFLLTMLDSGIYLLPDGRWYVSYAHSQQDTEETIAAVRKTFLASSHELAGNQRSVSTTT
jgi:glutamate-1-semialdehyde 2,1-aminomutase